MLCPQWKSLATIHLVDWGKKMYFSHTMKETILSSVSISSLRSHLLEMLAPKVMERCLSCQSLIPLCDLADHIQECTQEESRNDTEDLDEDLAMDIQQSLQHQMSPVQQLSITVIEDEVEAASALMNHNEYSEQHLAVEVEAVGAPQGVTSAQQHVWEQDTVEVLELVTENEGTSQ
ncbi:uncharacterized protein V3H82_000807 [Fundulus diaphanus]